MEEIYNEEYYRKIHRENAYAIAQAILGLRCGLNISENSKALCEKLMDDLYEEIGDEDIIIKVNMGDQ
ncbi:MAG: hypothetical protein J1F11_12735 [Oscillospiraceae bacterium]|nr:hypothetical protein [Oscillospiraceae bacterium]